MSVLPRRYRFEWRRWRAVDILPASRAVAATAPSHSDDDGDMTRAYLRLLAPAAALLLLPALAAAQQEGPVLKTGAVEISIGGRVQTQFNTTTVEDEPATETILRRVRLEASVRVNDWVTGKVQPDFAGDRVRVKDAYLKLELDPALELLAGKAQRPFGLLTQTSSTVILPVERGLRIRGVDGWEEQSIVEELEYADRDVGFQVMGDVRGAPLGLSYQAGWFAGPLQDAEGAEDSWQLAARVAVEPVPDLTLGASWSRRHFGVFDAEDVVIDTEAGQAWALDVEYGGFDPGLHLLGEAVMGDFDPVTGAEFAGAQGWLAWRTGAVSERIAAVEPVLRVSWADPDRDDVGGIAPGGTLVTPGLNLYLGGKNRVMFDYDLWSPDERDGEGSFKAMFQLAF